VKRKFLNIIVEWWDEDTSTGNVGAFDSTDMTLDITDSLDSIEDISLSATKALVHKLFKIPTSVQEGGRG